MGLYDINGVTRWPGETYWPGDTQLVNIETGKPAGTIAEAQAKTMQIVAEWKARLAREAAGLAVVGAEAVKDPTAATVGCAAVTGAEVIMPPVGASSELAAAMPA